MFYILGHTVNVLSKRLAMYKLPFFLTAVVPSNLSVRLPLSWLPRELTFEKYFLEIVEIYLRLGICFVLLDK